MRVIIADRHEVYRLGLRSAFADCSWIDVVAEAGDEAGLMDALQHLETDAVLVTSAISDDYAAIERIRQRTAGVAVVAVSVREDHRHLSEALETGADGYLLASADCREFVAALRRIADGGRYIQTELARVLFDTPPTPGGRLSGERLEILTLVAAGLRNKQIAKKLAISETTVKYHLRAIYEQLDATNRVGAVATALRTGLVD